MPKLAEVVTEPIGKKTYEMVSFFQDMIRRGELRAYSIEVNKRIVEKDTSDERIVRTIKGATLTPTESVRDNATIIVQDSKTGVMYLLSMDSEGGMPYDDGDSQTIYHNCTLEKLAGEFDSKKVTTRTEIGGLGYVINLPKDMVTARLRISYNENWVSAGETDVIGNRSGHLAIEGERDSLIDKIYEFVRGE